MSVVSFDRYSLFLYQVLQSFAVQCLFWALLEKKAFNWYYAAPTVHQIILQTGKSLLEERIKTFSLKMIANAAGGLLPSLAQELRDTFKAAVLPSYGMTECMPISSPPANYNLNKPGPSGVPVSPEVAILNTATVKPVPPMEEGPICVCHAFVATVSLRTVRMPNIL